MECNLEKDIPITDVSQDTLGRDKFAKNLSDAIIHYTADPNNTNCLVIGLEGAWGSGKTSLINLMKLHLQDEVITGTFNSWMTLKQSDMAGDFFKTLLKLIPQSELKQIGNKVQNLCKSILNGADLELTISDPAGISSLKAGKTFEFNSESLTEQKESLQSELAQNRKKWIVLFVDDIDRISSIEVSMLFQLIKNIADFPKVIYVLAYDRSVVVDALNQVQNNRGDEYLQKVVQVAFSVPSPDKDDLEEYFIGKINAVIKDREAYLTDEEHFWDLFRKGISHYLRNMRDCKRLVNTFSLKYSHCGNEVDIGDLIAITTLELFENSVFETIKSNKFYILGEGNYGFLMPEPRQLKIFADRLMDLASEGNKDYVRDLIDNMFPGFWQRVEAAPGRPLYKNNGIYSKICYSESFDKYFMLSIKSNEVSMESIHSFMKSDNRESVESCLKFWNEHHMTYYAFKKLTSLTDQIIKGQLKLRLTFAGFKCHLESLSNINLYYEEKGLLLSNFLLRDQFIKNYAIITLIDEGENQINFENLASTINDDQITLSIKAVLVQQAGQGRKWYFGENDPVYTSRKQLLSDKEFLQLRQLYLSMIKQKSSNEKEFFAEEKSKFVCLVWNKEDSEGYKNFMKNAKSGLDLANRCSIFLAQWTSNGNTTSYSWAENPDRFIDVNQSLKRLENFMHSADFNSQDSELREEVAAFYLLKTKKDKDGRLIGDVEINEIRDFLSKIAN